MRFGVNFFQVMKRGIDLGYTWSLFWHDGIECVSICAHEDLYDFFMTMVIMNPEFDSDSDVDYGARALKIFQFPTDVSNSLCGEHAQAIGVMSAHTP